jgi:hypothetical protein
MKVAALASERQIFDSVRTAVLPGDYMLDVVREAAVFLREKTVFAAVVRPPAH